MFTEVVVTGGDGRRLDNSEPTLEGLWNVSFCHHHEKSGAGDVVADISPRPASQSATTALFAHHCTDRGDGDV